MQESDLISDELKMNLYRSQQRMREVEDRKRRKVNFEVGDKVYLKLYKEGHLRSWQHDFMVRFRS